MYHVVFAHIIQAEREREIEDAIRRRHLLHPLDGDIESARTDDRRTGEARALTPRVRPTSG